jgi:rhomboid protease GluP
MMFVFGIIVPGVDNWAHAGGFAGGYLAGRVLDPLKPERVNHMLAAVICLVLSILSMVVSVLSGLPV